MLVRLEEELCEPLDREWGFAGELIRELCFEAVPQHRWRLAAQEGPPRADLLQRRISQRVFWALDRYERAK